VHQIARGGGDVRVPQLSLDDVYRHAFTSQLRSARVEQARSSARTSSGVKTSAGWRRPLLAGVRFCKPTYPRNPNATGEIRGLANGGQPLDPPIWYLQTVDESYVSALNRGVPAAAPGEFAALSIGELEIWPPVVLAPMAGITNYPFRTLCREFGAGLCVSEMITARALVERNQKTLKLSGFNPDERPRSLQLYGVDPHYVGEAVAFLIGEGLVDHIDMNFGCPVRKVTRRGGGAALPAKPRLLASILRSAVRRAGSVPVTVKLRIGIDDEIQTFRDAGRVAEQEGCKAVALHARTAAQLYSGHARWDAIAELKRVVETIPVLGNGDIWEAWDALRMMRLTGCDGVVVGRGCLGRPWLFRDLADVFAGRSPCNPPRFGEVARIMLRHAERLAEWLGEE
jgi:nifR3 family TIM-barrel protein